MNGSTSVIFEGKPIGTPDASAFFRVIDQHKVVGTFWSPTALRIIRQYDPEDKLCRKYPMEHLRSVFVAGEHCDRDTMVWARSVFGRRPVIDHYWQTETGSPVTSVSLGLEKYPVREFELSFLHMNLCSMRSISKFYQNLGPLGTAGRPCPGYDLHLLSLEHKKVQEEESADDELGRIVLKLPLPPGCFSTLWKNDKLFEEIYFSRYPGFYDTMDVGIRTEDDFIETSSRADDVLNVAGHRLSGAHIEQAIIESGKVLECAVIGLKDEIKGQVPFAFVVLHQAATKLK